MIQLSTFAINKLRQQFNWILSCWILTISQISLQIAIPRVDFLLYTGPFLNIQFSSVQSLSRVRLFATPWIAAHQASLSFTNSRSSPKLMSIESVKPSSHLILCCPLLLLPPIPSSIRVFPADFSKCAGILSAALSQHHLSGFEIAQLEFHHLH